MEDVNELLFKSWETFVQNTVQVAGYNKTVVCTIINDAEAIDGKFLVSDGATKFYAFTNSDPNLYKVDDTVYVLIPNGDYNKDKIILGRTTGDLEKPVNYVAPFDKYFDMTGNLLSDYYSNEYGLLANDDRANGSEICIAENIPVSVDDGNSFTRLGIKANFKSLTSTAITGNYGIKLLLNFTKNLNSSAEEISSITKFCYLDSTDMYGNPYNFATYFEQQLVFDIEEFTTDYDLTSMSIFFYQKRNFFIENNEIFPYKIDKDNYLKNNLFVKNIEISLGYEAGNEEKVIIYTNKDLKYTKGNNNLKPIKLRWCHLIENNECVAITNKNNIERWITNYTDDGRTVKIHWYDYNKDKNDVLGGSCWEEITPKDEDGNYLYQEFSIDFYPNEEEQSDSVKAIIELIDEDGLSSVIDTYEESKNYYIDEINKAKEDLAACEKKIEEYTAKNEATSSFIYLQNIEEQEALKAQYEENIKSLQSKLTRISLDTSAYYEYLKSNLLVFNNTEILEDKKSNYLRGISLYAEDGGVYRIYDSLTNDIISGEAVSNKRNLVLNFNHLFHNKGELTVKPKQIEWYFPKNNTMIDKPSTEERTSLDGESISISENNDYYIITYVNPILTTKMGEDEIYSEFKQKFNIKKHLLQTYSNNTVKVIIYVEDYVYELSIELIFGVCGQQGTNNTLIISTGDEYGSGITYDYLDDLPNPVTYPNKYVAIRQYQSASIDHNSGLSGCAKAGILSGNTVATFTLSPNDKLLSIFTDIDCCIQSNWSNYVQPTVQLQYTSTSGSTIKKTIQSESGNIQQNGQLKVNFTDIDTTKPLSIISSMVHGTDCIFVNNYKIVILKDTGIYKLYSKIDNKWELYKSNNTDYALIEHSPIAWTGIEDNKIELEARLYNANDELVPIEDNASTIWGFMYDHNDYTVTNQGVENGVAKAILQRKFSGGSTTRNGCIVTCTVQLGQIVDNYTLASGPYTSSLDYYELKENGTYSKVNSELLDLSTFSSGKYYVKSTDTCTRYRSYFNLPNRRNRNIKLFEGADRIIYQKSNGSMPTYYKGDYKINNNNITDLDLYYYSSTAKAYQGVAGYSLSRYYPTIKNNNISPKSMYLYNVNYDLQLEINNGEFYQPLLILNNQWGSSILNEWDGEFQVNEENGTILGTMLGAGKKETDNTFSGVLMGNVTKGAKDTSAGLGLFGYQSGIQSFGININGTAFIGKSSTAQLKFDGNEGIFQNAGYKDGTGINITMNGDPNQEQFISLKSNKIEHVLISTQSPYFRIKGHDDKTRFEVTNEKTTIGGWTVNKDTIKAGNITLNSNGSMSGGSSNKDWSIATDGTATFNYLKANVGGEIAGWTIGPSSLTGGNITIDSGGSISGGTDYEWSITKDGTATFKNIIATNSGTIGPYKVSSSSLSGNNVTLSGGDITLSKDLAKIYFNSKKTAYIGDTSGDGLSLKGEPISIVSSGGLVLSGEKTITMSSPSISIGSSGTTVISGATGVYKGSADNDENLIMTRSEVKSLIRSATITGTVTAPIAGGSCTVNLSISI